MFEAHEATHHQTRAHQQDERERHLGDDQQTPQTMTSASGGSAAAALLERLVQVRFGRLQCGRYTEDQCGQKGDPHREAYNATIKSELHPEGHLLRDRRQQQIAPPHSQNQTEGAAQQAQQHALGKQLPHNAQATGAKGRAQSQLFVSHRGPREH